MINNGQLNKEYRNIYISFARDDYRNNSDDGIKTLGLMN